VKSFRLIQTSLNVLPMALKAVDSPVRIKSVVQTSPVR